MTSRPDRVLEGPAVWRGDRLAESDDWIHRWSREEIVELENALVTARASERPLHSIVRDDFPLPTLAARLDQTRDELLRGRGFVLLRGLQPTNYSHEEIATIYWGIGAHLGHAVSQNAKGHLLGHVKDVGRDAGDPTARI